METFPPKDSSKFQWRIAEATLDTVSDPQWEYNVEATILIIVSGRL